MKVHRVVYLLPIILLMSCTTGSPHLPKGAKLVGGGLEISFSSPVDGTAIVLERSTGKIIATESITANGSPWEFGSAHVPNWEEMLASLFPATNGGNSSFRYQLPTNAFFELYFVPNSK